MGLKRTEMIEYLIKKQDYDEKIVKELELKELISLYRMYHND